MGVPPRPTALAGARFLGGHARSGSRSTLELAGVDSSLAGASRRGPLAHCDICGCVRWGLGVVACWALLGLLRRETLARLLALVDLLVARLVGGWKHGDRPSVVEGSASSAELSAGATIRATQEHTLGGWELLLVGHYWVSFGAKLSPDYWLWWTYWLPGSLAVGNMAIARQWGKAVIRPPSSRPEQPSGRRRRQLWAG